MYRVWILVVHHSSFHNHRMDTRHKAGRADRVRVLDNILHRVYTHRVVLDKDAPSRIVAVVGIQPVVDKDIGIGLADRDRKHKVPVAAEAQVPVHDDIQMAEYKLVAHGSNLVDMVLVPGSLIDF